MPRASQTATDRRPRRRGPKATKTVDQAALPQGWSDLAADERDDLPTYNEINSSDDLSDATAVAQDLEQIDWAFTDEDTAYLTHDLHSYPAKFIPQIPGHLIARLSLRGELVFDPFGGSGTTALEAVRMGRRALSVDANPLATLIGQVKTTRLDNTSMADIHTIRTSLHAHLTILPSDPASLLKAHSDFVPDIPNREKWFADSVCGELALIRSCIATMESERAKRLAQLALSRVVLKVSFQDSETRYASRPRPIAFGEPLRRYLLELDDVVAKVTKTSSDFRYGVVDFLTADARECERDRLQDESVDLVVTSPPYGNAFDYHLYHRFRLLWLGYDPRELAHVEIGSHLRHQRNGDGFESYLDDMRPCLATVHRMLKPGRFAAFVIGDPRYKGTTYEGAEAVAEVANEIGLTTTCIIERPIHKTRRSIVSAGRRASQEKILVVRKPPERRSWILEPPPYKLWNYEVALRRREIEAILGTRPSSAKKTAEQKVQVDPFRAVTAKRLTFSHAVRHEDGHRERTWQAILENGLASVESSRKDPKYVTHGLHPYKGKFYPQLAKGLINVAGVPAGSTVFDPFCGSGTTLLECYLNGLRPYGCDMHPLAAKIARAKVGILELSPDMVSEAVQTVVTKIDSAPSRAAIDLDQFAPDCIDEIESWFPHTVVGKLNHLLRIIRSVSAGTLLDFFEVVLSSIIRDVSHQEPSDLRIRRRKQPLVDADVFGMFKQALLTQYERVEKFWTVRGYCPFQFHTPTVVDGDSRKSATFDKLKLSHDSVDFILTSPPYATALPYIDTDRLSLLVLNGMDVSDRRPLEQELTGSREIRPAVRRDLEDQIVAGVDLPDAIVEFLVKLFEHNSKDDVGFRRRNMPALLLRFFRDMRQILENCVQHLKPGGEAMVVVGDSRTTVNGDKWVIPTTRFIELIGQSVGLELVERIGITVTTDNHKHIKNAITENGVIRLKRVE